MLFNLFINKVGDIFDQSCDPVNLGDQKLNALLWADDLVILSSTPSGLQNAINKTNTFYTSLGLDMNKKKTKVMIFNLRGIKITNQVFTVCNHPIG